MDTVRIARDLGDVSSLFPEGCRSLLDLPYPLHDAISYGLQFLAFLELPKEEQPPRVIWLNGDKLKEHFDAVEKRRKEEIERPGDQIEDPVQNDAASMLLSGG